MAVICVVDDDCSVRRGLSNLLRAEGYDVISFASGEELLAEFKNLAVSCILLDLKMPGLSGTDVLQALALHSSTIPVICMSAHWDSHSLQLAARWGAVDCLRKPFVIDQLLSLIVRLASS